jgi:hypothetical protein
MPKVYHNLVQTSLRLAFFDRVKNCFMPYDVSKYIGFDYFWRVACASQIIVGLNLALSYPLDLIHTRISGDMSRKGTARLFQTTFDCFNKTNLEETRNGLYKGAEIAFASAVGKQMLQLPVYSVVKDFSDKSESKFQRVLGASMLSSTLVSLLIYPLDTLKKTAQTNGGRGFMGNFSSSWDVCTKLPGQLGLMGMYRGAHLYFLSNLVSAFCQF